MRKLVAMLSLVGALAVPAAAAAQSAEPSPILVGFGSMDVCLTITGPVVLMTPETLTQGFADGTFTIDAIVECAAPDASPEASAAPAAPEASASPAGY